MPKLFYIMPESLSVLNDSKPAYTPMTNHKTELHAVPMIAFSEYSNLIGIIEDIKQQDISDNSPNSKINLSTIKAIADAIQRHDAAEMEILK